MSSSFQFKTAKAAGDTFADASTSDVLMCLNNGANSRAILAGFVNTATGAVAGTSKMRITSNAVSVAGVLSASSLGIGTVTPQSALDVVGSISVSSNLNVVGSLAIGSNLTITGGLTVQGNIVSAGQTLTGGGTSAGGGGVSTSILSNVGSNVVISGGLTVLGTLVAGSLLLDSGIGSNAFPISTSNTASVTSIHVTSNVTFGPYSTSLGSTGTGSNVVLTGGDLQLSNNMSVSKGLSVAGTVNLASNLNILGSTSIGSNLTIAGGLTVLGSIVSAGQTVGSSSLGSNVGSNIVVNGGLIILGTLVASEIQLGSGSISSTTSSNTVSYPSIHVNSNVTFGSNNVSLGVTNSGSNVILTGGDLQLTSNLVVSGYQSNVGNVYGFGASNVGGVCYTAVHSNAGAMSVGNLTVGGSVYSGAPFRNRFLNGDMRVDQRFGGAPQNNCTNGWYPIADRIYYGSTIGSATISQQNNSQYASMGSTLGVYFPSVMMVQVTTAATVGNTDYTRFDSHLEGLQIADFGWGTPNALPVVLSFYVYSNVVGTYSASLMGNNGNQNVALPFSVVTAGVWQRVMLNFPGNTQAGWVINNGAAVNITITLASGSSAYATTPGAWMTTAGMNSYVVSGQTNFMATVGNQILITGIQLEKGTQVTPFEFRPYPVELQMCQRHLVQYTSTGPSQRMTAFSGFGNSTGGLAFSLLQLPVTMRAIPILNTNFASAWGGNNCGLGGERGMQAVSPNSGLTLNAIDSTPSVVSVYGTYSGSSLPSFISGFFCSMSANQYIQFNAEA